MEKAYADSSDQSPSPRMFAETALSLQEGERVIGGYRVLKRIGYGGSSVIFKAEPVLEPLARTSPELVALKVYLPLFWEDFLQVQLDSTRQRVRRDLRRYSEAEYAGLARIRHPGIVRVIDSGVFMPEKNEVIPQLQEVAADGLFYIVEDYLFADRMDHVLDTIESGRHFVTILRDVCHTLQYLHEDRSYMHLDLYPGNIMIDQAAGRAVLIDFGLYRDFNFREVDKHEKVLLEVSRQLAPRSLSKQHDAQYISEVYETRERLKELIFPGLDLYQFGCLIRDTLPKVSGLFQKADLRYLERLQRELLDWESTRGRTAEWLDGQLAKVDPSYAHFMGVEELSPPSSSSKTIQLTGGDAVASTPLVNMITSTRSFQRLRTISQLGFVNFMYPGATHNRLLHSFRTYARCAELIQTLQQSADFRLIFDETLARQALAIALLHDINHFPFLHVFQEVRDDIAESAMDLDLYDYFLDGKATADTPSLYKIVLDQVQLEPTDLKSLLTFDYESVVENYGPGYQLLKSMIDSGADIDKLAYLRDDSVQTGVAYGSGIDVDRLLASATVAQVDVGVGSGWHLAFKDEGLSAVESLVMARYWLFRNVYWHRTNRAMLAMLMNVMRRVYSRPGASFKDYVRSTMWRSEDSAVAYLNAEFRKHDEQKRDSIIADIYKDPRTVYQRLLTVRGRKPATSAEIQAYESLVGLRDKNPAELEAVRTRFADGLMELLSDARAALRDIGADDVLIDIPGRRMDSGNVWLVDRDGNAQELGQTPGPIHEAAADLDSLTKRLRIFVHPRIAEVVTAKLSEAETRSEALKLLRHSIQAKKSDQIK